MLASALEDAGLVVDQIAALGDRQADDACGRVGEHPQHTLGVAWRERVRAERADHAGRVTLGAALDHGVQAVLGIERVGHALIGRQQADAALAPTRGDSLLGQIVQVDGLVGAVEPANAQVHDRTRDLAPIVRRHGDAIGNSLERCLVEGLLGHVCRMPWPHHMSGSTLAAAQAGGPCTQSAS